MKSSERANCLSISVDSSLVQSKVKGNGSKNRDNAGTKKWMGS